MTQSGSIRPIGVLGATGQQGGAVVDALLALGAPVRAIVRAPDSAKSTALAARGVDVVHGDQDDPADMLDAFAGLSALFLMFTFTDAAGTQGEINRGTAVADVAVRAGVPRVVYSSVGGAERHSGVPHFESKRRIEEHLDAVLASEFIRPAYFIENLTGQLPRDGDTSGEIVIRMPMPGDVALQMVSVVDIGKVAAAALLEPGTLGGQALEIAGDELTGDQLATTVGRHFARPARYEEVPLDVLGDDDDLKAMFRWFVETPAYQADIARTRTVEPELLDVAGWLAQR